MNRLARHVSLILFAVLCLFCRAQLLDLRLAGANARFTEPALQPQLTKYGESNGLALSATFLNDSPQRACWDFPIKENLTHCAGIRLRFYCVRPAVARQYNLYIRTGNVWQASTFSPVGDSVWQELFIPKAHFLPETTAASWQQASTLRLALWKGTTGQTVLHLASVEFVRPNGPVAIIRSGSSGKTLQEAYRYADQLNTALVAHGIYPAVIEQDDTTYLNLRPYSFLYLPQPAAASAGQLANLASYIRRGGKAAVFHALPPILQQAMGFPAGRYTSSTCLGSVQINHYALPLGRSYRQPANSFIQVKALTGSLKTVAVWQDTTGHATTWPAILESNAGFWITHAFLNKDPQNTPAAMASMAVKFIPALRQNAAYAKFEQARKAYADTKGAATEKSSALRTLETARSNYESGQYESSIQLSQDCLNALASIGIPPVAPNPAELRALWCKIDTGLPGTTWKTTAALLKDADMNTVFMYSGSPLLSNFSSRVTPLSNATHSLPQCIRQCRAQGLQIHAWFDCLSLADESRNPSLQNTYSQWASQGRLQQDDSGKPLPWLCPSDMRNRRHLVQIISEMAVAYPLDGIHLDFIRFPSSSACFCPSCRKAFELYLGRTTQWPQAVKTGGMDHTRWLDFRQQVITTLVQSLAQTARQARPGIKISAAVYPDLVSASASVGQDWHTWVAARYVDFLCPMNYQTSVQAFLADIQRQKQQLPNAFHQLVPGIGASVHNLSQNQVRQQIYATRQEKTAGFALFALAPREAQEILPTLLK